MKQPTSLRAADRQGLDFYGHTERLRREPAKLLPELGAPRVGKLTIDMARQLPHVYLSSKHLEGP